eukprot:TRINITY_DN9162_c0_g1_i1.p1 TRINITY_DN9162_c0_g1~~TRINITY_DN9162_c0_g1_i1.p1  ORF type:complete len:223 (-),score=72.22 TRINITY_DN9162_c0_g1_i1:42-710(-)
MSADLLTQQINTVSHTARKEKRRSLLSTWQTTSQHYEEESTAEQKDGEYLEEQIPVASDQMIDLNERELENEFLKLREGRRISIASPDSKREINKGKEKERFEQNMAKEIQEMKKESHHVDKMFQQTKSNGQKLIDRTLELEKMGNAQLASNSRIVQENAKWNDQSTQIEQQWKKEMLSTPNKPSQIEIAIQNLSFQHLIWALVFIILFFQTLSFLKSTIFG